MEEISAAIGKKAGVLAVCDRGFAEKLKQLIADARTCARLARFRRG